MSPLIPSETAAQWPWCRPKVVSALVIALALPLAWLCIPGTRDRVVKADGTVACIDPLDVDDVEAMPTPASRAQQVSELVTSQKCWLMLANDRVRLEEISGDGSKANVLAAREGRKAWIANSALRPFDDRWFTVPWLWYRIFSSEVETLTAVDADTKGIAKSNDTDRTNAAETFDSVQSENPFEKFLQPAVDSRRISLRPWLSIELAPGWEPNDKVFGEAISYYMKYHGMDDEHVRDSFMARKLDIFALKSVAHMNVRFYPNQTFTQGQVAAMTSEDVTSFDGALHLGLLQVAAQSGFRVEVWTGTTLEKIAGLNMLVTRYTRTSVGDEPQNKVSMFRVLDGPHSFTLTTSYALDTAEETKIEADKIAETILINSPN